ncbi:hypothetical protein Sjap_019735 [Stephania japonica]|uniref:Uncharacterized protein n=1 Tax=Stephania japonica TaxID=461633 RepID=A0AAP0HZM9_9MAGN
MKSAWDFAGRVRFECSSIEWSDFEGHVTNLDDPYVQPNSTTETAVVVDQLSQRVPEESGTTLFKSSLAMQRQRTGRLKLSDLEAYFHLPVEVAAKKLGTQKPHQLQCSQAIHAPIEGDLRVEVVMDDTNQRTEIASSVYIPCSNIRAAVCDGGWYLGGVPIGGEWRRLPPSSSTPEQY